MFSSIRKLIGGTPVVMYSPHSVSECERRIKDCIDADGFLSFWQLQVNPIVGYVDGATLRLRKRISYRNGFQTVLRAQFEVTKTGAIIRGKFGARIPVAIFLWPWFVFNALFFLGGCIAIVAAAPHFTSEKIHSLASSAGMFAGGLSIITFCRWLSRNEAPYLEKFLEQTIDATKTPV